MQVSKGQQAVICICAIYSCLEADYSPVVQIAALPLRTWEQRWQSPISGCHQWILYGKIPKPNKTLISHWVLSFLKPNLERGYIPCSRGKILWREKVNKGSQCPGFLQINSWVSHQWDQHDVTATAFQPHLCCRTLGKISSASSDDPVSSQECFQSTFFIC